MIFPSLKRTLRAALLPALLAGAPAVFSGAETAPMVLRSGAGRFEVIAPDARVMRDALGLAEAVWTTLAVPLALPPGGFSPSEIPLRCAPVARGDGGAEPFSVTTEPGGRVLVTLRCPAETGSRPARHALVRALLTRQVVARGGAPVRPPPWLEEACAEHVLTRTFPALLDAARAEASREEPPALEALLAARGELTPELRRGALLLMDALLAERDGARRLQTLARRLLSGGEPIAALDAVCGDLWDSARGRALWWRTVFHAQAGTFFPAAAPAEASRLLLRDLCRWVAVVEGRETVLPLERLAEAAPPPWMREELRVRVALLRHHAPAAHPFYRNALVALEAFYGEVSGGNPDGARRARGFFIGELLAARRLEQACARALDGVEGN
ncbi:MAG: hypothetical protein LBR12_00370 [Opitutaceae bacterium]|nr:hypothetical protein [Opitutaceae bacterium]